MLGKRPSRSHVAARQEVESQLAALKLPINEKGLPHKADSSSRRSLGIASAPCRCFRSHITRSNRRDGGKCPITKLGRPQIQIRTESPELGQHRTDDLNTKRTKPTDFPRVDVSFSRFVPSRNAATYREKPVNAGKTASQKGAAGSWGRVGPGLQNQAVTEMGACSPRIFHEYLTGAISALELNGHTGGLFGGLSLTRRTSDISSGARENAVAAVGQSTAYPS
jgi:hypothetical protein